jgi:hypothetical protein
MALSLQENVFLQYFVVDWYCELHIDDEQVEWLTRQVLHDSTAIGVGAIAVGNAAFSVWSSSPVNWLSRCHNNCR